MFLSRVMQPSKKNSLPFPELWVSLLVNKGLMSDHLGGRGGGGGSRCKSQLKTKLRCRCTTLQSKEHHQISWEEGWYMPFLEEEKLINIVHRAPHGITFMYFQKLTFCYLSKKKRVLCAGRHNLRSFLAANSTQNYFLIARMLRFLWHSRQKCGI